MEKSVLLTKSYSFSVDVLREYKVFSKALPRPLSNQLIKSSTSVGANIAEANGTGSIADFTNKLSIAYKETLETKYWLDLLKDSDYISGSLYNKLYAKADEISKMLYTSIKTAKNSNIKSNRL